MLGLDLMKRFKVPKELGSWPTASAVESKCTNKWQEIFCLSRLKCRWEEGTNFGVWNARANRSRRITVAIFFSHRHSRDPILQNRRSDLSCLRTPGTALAGRQGFFYDSIRAVLMMRGGAGGCYGIFRKVLFSA